MLELKSPDSSVHVEPMKEPAKRWVNEYRAITGLIELGGGTRRPGDVFRDDGWPSKEIAEQKALERVARAYRKFGEHLAEHRGAFPEADQ